MITISRAKFEEIAECVRDRVAFGHNMALQPLGHAEFIRECCESLVEEIEARGVGNETERSLCMNTMCSICRSTKRQKISDTPEENGCFGRQWFVENYQWSPNEKEPRIPLTCRNFSHVRLIRITS